MPLGLLFSALRPCCRAVDAACSPSPSITFGTHWDTQVGAADPALLNVADCHKVAQIFCRCTRLVRCRYVIPHHTCYSALPVSYNEFARDEWVHFATSVLQVSAPQIVSDQPADAVSLRLRMRLHSRSQLTSRSRGAALGCAAFLSPELQCARVEDVCVGVGLPHSPGRWRVRQQR